MGCSLSVEMGLFGDVRAHYGAVTSGFFRKRSHHMASVHDFATVPVDIVVMVVV